MHTTNPKTGRRSRFMRRMAVVAALSGLTLAPAAPAQAQPVHQLCRVLAAGEICISYNYTTRTVAANYKNTSAGSQSITLRITNSAGANFTSWQGTVARGQWKGIYLSNRSWGEYFGVANGAGIGLPPNEPPEHR